MMTLGFAYWLLMVLWLVLGIWASWPNWRTGAPSLLLFLLLVILGYKCFGPPIHG